MSINSRSVRATCSQPSLCRSPRIFFSEAYQILQTKQKDEKYNFYMYAFYGNMAECLILQDRLEEAKPYLEYLHKDGWEQVALTERLFIDIVDVIYYHKMGDVQKRNESIQMIHQNLPDNLTVLDFFSDYYRCCLVLLETDQDESFWRIIEVIEPQVVNFKIINLHLKVLSLKMKFYRKHNQNAEYLQAAGLYYELSERNEVVTRNMLSSMITLRKNLENMRKARMKAERKNMVLQERSEQDPFYFYLYLPSDIRNRSANYGYSTAVGLFKSLVGCVLVLICNWASKKTRGRGIV